MKIGILTHWWSNDNYGQQLQCYALQKYLRDAGHEPFLIRYYPHNDNIKPPFLKRVKNAITNPILFYRSIKTIVKQLVKKKTTNQFNKARNFEGFRNKYIKQSNVIYYSYNQLKENPPEAEAYIVGSDQVWGLNARRISYSRNRLNAWFLNFGSEDTLRISYAASWGDKKIPEQQAKEIEPLLRKFDFVSVRESSGIFICEQCGIKNARWMPDPTLLFQSDVYRALFQGIKSSVEGGDYILFYWLDNGTKNPKVEVMKWASNNNLLVVYVTGNTDKSDSMQKDVSIEEWLYLIDNSKYVITNSFHCCLFSMVFHVPFGVIPLEGKMERLNERMYSLFRSLEIEDRFIYHHNYDFVKNSIDYRSFDKNLMKIRDGNNFSEILNQL